MLEIFFAIKIWAGFNLFWIFEYVTSEPFGEVPIGKMLKNSLNFCSNGYFEFWVKNWQKRVKICKNLVEWFPTYWWSSNFWHWMGGGQSVYHEGWMIGIQCEMIILEDILEHLRVHFNFFVVDSSMADWHFSQIFHFGLQVKSNLKGS